MDVLKDEGKAVSPRYSGEEIHRRRRRGGRGKTAVVRFAVVVARSAKAQAGQQESERGENGHQ